MVFFNKSQVQGVDVREVNEVDRLRTGVEAAQFTATDALSAFVTARENLLIAAEGAFAVADKAQNKAHELLDLSYEAHVKGEEYERQAQKIAEALGLPVAEAQNKFVAYDDLPLEEWETELLGLNEGENA